MIENETIEIGLLEPHPANYNQHSDQQIERLRVSLRKFGQPRPIVAQRREDGEFWIVAVALERSAEMTGGMPVLAVKDG